MKFIFLSQQKYLSLKIAFVIFVLVLTHIPPLILTNTIPWSNTIGKFDKLWHGLLYGLITLLFLFGAKISIYRWFCMIVPVLIIIAGFDELTQPLVQRTFSLGDWAADIFGIIGFSIIILMSNSSYKKIKKA